MSWVTLRLSHPQISDQFKFGLAHYLVAQGPSHWLIAALSVFYYFQIAEDCGGMRGESWFSHVFVNHRRHYCT